LANLDLFKHPFSHGNRVNLTISRQARDRLKSAKKNSKEAYWKTIIRLVEQDLSVCSISPETLKE